MSLRFNDYREIEARYDGEGCRGARTGPHPVHQGDRIGYARRGRRSLVVCADCWRRWSDENAEADRYEAGLP